MPPPPRHSRRRLAQGRELAAKPALSDDGAPRAEARISGAALDVIARSRAEPQLPLDALVRAVATERGAGARDRRALGDLAFAWARRRAAFEPRAAATLKAQGGMRPKPRDVDRVSLAVAALESDLEIGAALVRSLAPELRALLDDVLAQPTPPTALPPWLRERLARGRGAELEALLAALTGRALPVLAIDTRVTTSEVVRDALLADGVHTTPSPVTPSALRVVEGRLRLGALPEALRAAVWPMDDASQAVALALGAHAGDLVVDACAGGGGKTRLLASRGARVIAADRSRDRLTRSVTKDAAVVVGDASTPPFRERSIARILVDAPCTGTGTLRRAPDLANRLTPHDVEAAVTQQRAILAGAASLLAPGGTLIYATCSLLQDENEDVVAHALRTFPDLAPTPLDALWGDAVRGSAPGASTRTFLPSLDGTDGFFVAALTRRP